MVKSITGGIQAVFLLAACTFMAGFAAHTFWVLLLWGWEFTW